MVRLIEIDPKTSQTEVVYEGTTERPLDSITRSKEQRLANGDTLIVEAQGGRVFEVDPKGETVWEYVNATPDKDGVVRTVGLVTQAERIPNDYATFLQ